MAELAKTVLLVEDDPNDVLLLQRALRKGNFICDRLQFVGDGDKATDYLSGVNGFASREKHPLPALLILDLKLPCRSGFEVLAWLRERPEFKYLPVVILTSSKHAADMRRAYELGANSYLLKPVDFDRLCSMIGTLMAYWLNMNQDPDRLDLV
jgi:CheY-like chemotaxis protein